MKQRLSELLNIRHGESRVVGLMLIYALLMGMPGIITETAAYSLFLTEFGAEAIPYVYVGFAVVTSLLGFVFTRLEAKLPIARLLLVVLVVLGVPLLLFRLLIAADVGRWSVVALAVWSDTIWVLVSLSFWGLATHLFTLRQGKRLFGLLGAGMFASEVASGFAMPLLVRWLGTANLLFVAGGAVLAALVLQSIITKKYASHLVSPEDDPIAHAKSWPQLLKEHYIALIFALAALNLVAYYLIDNIFYGQVEARYVNPDQLAGFIGVFFATAGLLTSGVGALVSGRFFHRFGLQTGLLVLPVVLFAGTLLIATVPVLVQTAMWLFWAVVALKLANEVLKDSVNQAAMLVLYQPLPVGNRLKIQTAVEGIIRPLAGGFAGILLILLATFFNLSGVQLAVGLVLVLSVWIAVTLALAANYPRTLLQALSRQKLTGAVLDFEDPASHATLQQALHHPRPTVALYAVQMLHQNRPDLLQTALPELLCHPTPEVRLEALRQIARLELTCASEAIGHCLASDDDPHVRAAAMGTLAELGPVEAMERIYPFLESADAALKLGAIRSILRFGSPELAIMAQGRLLQLVVSLNPAERIQAAQIMGSVHTHNLHHALGQLLQDDEILVRRAALHAAGWVRYRQLWPQVVRAVKTVETRAAAAAALVAGGDQALPAIEQVLGREQSSQIYILRLVRVLQRIGSPAAVAILVDYIDQPDEVFRTAVLTALCQCGYQADDQTRLKIEQQLNREVCHSAGLLAALVDLRAGSTNTPAHLLFLINTLHTQLQRANHRIFACLSFLANRQTVLQVQASLALKSAEKQAYALEVLDTTIPVELKRQVMPLLEPLSPQQRLQRLKSICPQTSLEWHHRLKWLIAGNGPIHDDWLKACAIHSLETIDAELVATIRQELPPAPANALLHQTTARLLARLDPALQRVAPTERAFAAHLMQTYCAPNVGGHHMLSDIEKVIILKSVNLFKHTPNEILVELASLLEEVRLAAGEVVFSKGAPGDCMYIIVSGQVKVHTETHVLNHLGEGEVFGEMALLDSQPRMASITTVDETHLLRLDQAPFYILMEDHVEVAREVIHVLAGHVRLLARQATAMNARLDAQSQQILQ